MARQQSKDYSVLNQAFDLHAHREDDGENPGFSYGFHYGSGLGLKRIYNLWFIQNHQRLITEQDRQKYTTDEYIKKFLDKNSLDSQATTSDDTDDDDHTKKASTLRQLSISEQVLYFHKALETNHKLKADYFSLSKLEDVGTDINYGDHYINDFLDFMGLHGSRATYTCAGLSNDVSINTELTRMIFEEKIGAGVYLKRFIQIKVRQKFKLEGDDNNIQVTLPSANADASSLDIPRSMLPHINLVADTLWNTRIEQRRSLSHVHQVTGIALSTLSYIESGRFIPNAQILFNLFWFYGKINLLSDSQFMAPVLQIDQEKNPVGYQLKLLRFKKGWTTNEAQKRSGISKASIHEYESGRQPISPLALKELLTAYGRIDLFSDPQFISHVIQTKKRERPVAYQLMLERYKNGYNSAQTVATALHMTRAMILNLESGLSLPSNPATLHKLLTFYKRLDLYDDPSFMAPLLKINRHKFPVAYLLKLERYRKGWSTSYLSEASDVSAQEINEIESARKPARLEILKKILPHLSKTGLLNDPAFMGQVDQSHISPTIVANVLESERLNRRMSTTELAEAAGVDIQVIRYYKRGAGVPDILNVRKLLVFFNRTDLLHNEDFMSPIVATNKRLFPLSFQLRLIRFQQGWTTSEVAKKAGFSEYFMNTCETGHAEMTPPGVLLAVLNAYNRTDLYDNQRMMSSYISIDAEQYPFSYALKLARYKKGFIAKQAIQGTGLHKLLIYKLESGNNLNTAKAHLSTLCKALDMNVIEAEKLLLEQIRLNPGSAFTKSSQIQMKASKAIITQAHKVGHTISAALRPQSQNLALNSEPSP